MNEGASGDTTPSESSPPILDVRGVSKRFTRELRRSQMYGLRDILSEFNPRSVVPKPLRSGEFWAVDDVSFSVRRGEAWGVLGANGAGKSTLLRMIAGLTRPDTGSIQTAGRIGTLLELSLIHI